jgi:hypothetical protein
MCPIGACTEALLLGAAFVEQLARGLAIKSVAD